MPPACRGVPLLGSTPSAPRSRTRGRALVASGLHLEEDPDPALAVDSRGRRMGHARHRSDRLSIQEALGRTGFARPGGTGQARAQLAALEAQARAARRGRVWGGG